MTDSHSIRILLWQIISESICTSRDIQINRTNVKYISLQINTFGGQPLSPQYHDWVKRGQHQGTNGTALNHIIWKHSPKNWLWPAGCELDIWSRFTKASYLSTSHWFSRQTGFEMFVSIWIISLSLLLIYFLL